MGNVHGRTAGLKASHFDALERLYRRRIAVDVATSADLVRELAEVSHELRRRVAVLADRQGEVTHVVVGDATTLELPDLDGFRRGAGRLKGLRAIATALGRDEPSQSDLTGLVRNRLDLLVVVAVGEGGRPWSLRTAHVAPPEPVEPARGRKKAPLPTAGVTTVVSPPLPPHGMPPGFLAFIEDLEARLEAATPRAVATGEREGRRLILAVVGTGEREELDARLAELRELARAAGAEVAGELVQRREKLAARTLLGKGRVQDLAGLVLAKDATSVVLDPDLSPSQHEALEAAVGVPVIDRTQLILDIFGDRARTRAGKLQVEVARLRYLLPRLAGRRDELARPGAASTRGGAGEQQLELDRRGLRRRIRSLEEELEKLGRQRRTGRARRERSELAHVAIVGTTNVGKSTLFNRITDAKVAVEDRLFETLDPTVRKRRLPSGRFALFSDTVGFLRELPKDLVQAFAATLDELRDARLLLHVADASDPRAFERIAQVRALLKEQGLDTPLEVLVFNKRDRVDEAMFLPLARSAGGTLVISALDGGDVERLVGEVDRRLAELDAADAAPGEDEGRGRTGTSNRE